MNNGHDECNEVKMVVKQMHIWFDFEELEGLMKQYML